MKLIDAPIGVTLILKSFECERCHSSRLAALGLFKGRSFKVISNSGHGQLLVKVGESSLTLCRGMSENIIVEEVYDVTFKTT